MTEVEKLREALKAGLALLKEFQLEIDTEGDALIQSSDVETLKAALEAAKALEIELADLKSGKQAILPQTHEHAQNLYTVAVACLKSFGEDVEAASALAALPSAPVGNGWAICDAGKVLVASVSKTRIAAMVNWLVVHRGLMITNDTTDEAIEAFFETQKSTAECCEVAISALPAQVPGFVMVPVEPTEEMIAAGISERHLQGVPEAWKLATVNIYKAMLAAAPASPASGTGGT